MIIIITHEITTMVKAIIIYTIPKDNIYTLLDNRKNENSF